MRRHKPKPGWCFMRTIDREAHADELSRDSAVNEAGYSRDPGGITPHSSLISRKAAWNPNAILPDECTLSVSLLSLSSFCLSLTPLLSHSHSVFWAWWMQSESINLFPCWIPDKIYKDKLNKLLMGWPISLCVCMCWIDLCLCVCVSCGPHDFQFLHCHLHAHVCCEVVPWKCNVLLFCESKVHTVLFPS